MQETNGPQARDAFARRPQRQQRATRRGWPGPNEWMGQSCAKSASSAECERTLNQPFETVKMIRKSHRYLECRRYANYMFHAHCRYILEHFLVKESMLKWIRAQHSGLATQLAVVVENRITRTLKSVILNTLLMCPRGTRVLLLTTKDCLPEAERILGTYSGLVSIRSLDESVRVVDQQTYSEMLKKEEFWQNLEAEKLLIFQADSLLLEPLPEHYFEFSYIGAPFAMGKYLSHRFPVYNKAGARVPDEYEVTMCGNNTLRTQLPLGYGNGGLSIRRRSAMINTCRSVPATPGEPEDLYFSKHVEVMGGKTATPADAERFSSEQTYNNSIGIHASWLYLEICQQGQMYDKHLRQLIAISRAVEG